MCVYTEMKFNCCSVIPGKVSVIQAPCWRGHQTVQTSTTVVSLKVALQIFGRKFCKNTEISSLYPQSLLVFIHKTPVVEKHPITREIRD